MNTTDSNTPNSGARGLDNTLAVPSQPAYVHLPTSLPQLAQGQTLAEGRYQVLGLIGQGGMGAVYSVEQTYLKKKFALKILLPLSGGSTGMVVRRFQKEAQAASKLDHPNLVQAVDFGLIGEDQPFLVMDFVQGDTLAKYLASSTRGRLT